MGALIVLVAGLVLVAALCALGAFLLSPGACIALAVALALAPACCAWCFEWLDRREARARQARGPLTVIDKGDR